MATGKKQLKDLMDILPEGIISMDVNGNITQVNKGTIDLLGYNSFNLIGKPIFDFAPKYVEEDIKRLFKELDNVDTIKERKVQLFDVKGRLLNLKISLSVLRDQRSNPIGVVSTIDEVKEEVKLEKELREIKDFSENILNSAGVGILATDLKGNIIFASKGAGGIFNGPAEELIGQNLIKSSPTPLELNEKFSRLIRSGKSFEYDLVTKEQGQVRNFINIFTLLKDKRGKPLGSIVVFEDISHIKGVEEELKNTNAILRRYSKDLESIVDTTRMLGSSLEQEEIFKIMAGALGKTMNVEVSCFFKLNKSREKLFLNSIVGLKINSLKKFNLELEKNGFNSFLKVLKAPKIVARLLEEQTFYIAPQFLGKGLKSAVFVPLFTKGRFFGVLTVFFKDHREFRKDEIEILQSIGNSCVIAIENARLYNEIKEFATTLEEKVKERTAELEQSNMLKDLFIDIMGHDLLKPADIARLSTELIMDLEDDPDKVKILKNILQSQVRIIDLIENASILAKLESGGKLEFKVGDLGVVLRSVADETADLADKKNIKIEVMIDGEYPAMINPLIYDVFSNLLGNAAKYGPSDSTVVASISDDSLNWKFSVVDNGEGIPDEHKETIFNRFKRLEKGAVKGSGLGLAIVKRVVKAHNGRVWVEDNPDGGSIFCVQIPKA
jgi:PAS domain S-box-containing protein